MMEVEQVSGSSLVGVGNYLLNVAWQLSNHQRIIIHLSN